MASSKWIVDALATLAESRYSSQLAKASHGLSSSSQNLVGVALMRYIPNDIVFWHVEYVVKGYSEFIDSEWGWKVTSGFRHWLQGFPSQFIGKLYVFLVWGWSELWVCVWLHYFSAKQPNDLQKETNKRTCFSCRISKRFISAGVWIESKIGLTAGPE